MTFAPDLCLVPAVNLYFCFFFILFCFVLFYLLFRFSQRPQLQKKTCSKYHPCGDWFYQSSDLTQRLSRVKLKSQKEKTEGKFMSSQLFEM